MVTQGLDSCLQYLQVCCVEKELQLYLVARWGRARVSGGNRGTAFNSRRESLRGERLDGLCVREGVCSLTVEGSNSLDGIWGILLTIWMGGQHHLPNSFQP